jgi:hypothetical protein
VLRVRHPDGAEDIYLLLDADGKPARAWVRGKVGIPVQAEGEEEEVDGWRVLRLGSEDGLQRTK